MSRGRARFTTLGRHDHRQRRRQRLHRTCAHRGHDSLRTSGWWSSRRHLRTPRDGLTFLRSLQLTEGRWTPHQHSLLALSLHAFAFTSIILGILSLLQVLRWRLHWSPTSAAAAARGTSLGHRWSMWRRLDWRSPATRGRRHLRHNRRPRERRRRVGSSGDWRPRSRCRMSGMRMSMRMLLRMHL